MRSIIKRAALAAVTALVMTVGLVPVANAVGGPTPPVTVTWDPDSQIVVAGETVQFEAAAEDKNFAPVPVLRWDVLAAGATAWTAVDGSAGRDVLVLTDVSASMDGGMYRAVFLSGLGGTIASNEATLTVGYVPSFTTQPVGSTVAPGASFTLTAVADGNPAPTISWQQSSSSSEGPWEEIWEFGETLTWTASSETGTGVWFRAVASNEIGMSASDAALVQTGDAVPGAVANLSASNPSARSLAIAWNAPSVGGPATEYEVTVLQGTTPVRTATVTTRSVTYTQAAGTYKVTVKAKNASGAGAPKTVSVVVNDVAAALSLSASTVRPYRDGYQDSVTLRATSNFPSSGTLKVVNSSGRGVSWTLASGTAWSKTFTGRDAAGRLLPVGTYTAKLTLGGKVVATKTVMVKITDSTVSSATWSASSFYPKVDGYQDSARITVRTSMPATIQIKVRKVGSWTVVGSTSLSTRTYGAYTWNGRVNGVAVAAGTYRATIVVKGGDGPAHTYTRDIVVSSKQLTGVRTTKRIGGYDAMTSVIVGDPWEGAYGSVTFYSSYYSDEIAAFSGRLASSSGGRYTDIKLKGCLDHENYDNMVGVVLFDGAGDVSDRGFAMPDKGCGQVSVPASYVSNGYVDWFAGNVTQNYDFGIVEYWEISYTRYVLK